MKKLVFPFALGLSLSLSLSMMVGFGVNVSAQTADINIKVSGPGGGGGAKCDDKLYTEDKSKQASQSLKLYYIRSAPALKGILNSIATANPCIAGTVIEAQGKNTIVLYGNEAQRKALQRVIAVLDLPRERVNMEMWGILISSDNTQQLAEVMGRVNKEIDTTQNLLRETYKKLEEYARKIDIHDGEIPNEFEDLLEKDLGYKDALSNQRPSLSMIDILLRLVAAKDPIKNHSATAKNLCDLFKEEEYEPYTKAFKKDNKIPFENFLKTDLFLKKEQISSLIQNCEADIENKNSTELQERRFANLDRRRAVLHFALQYSNLANDPASFDLDALQQSAETLNSVLQPIVDAINRDVEELFIEPTLARIQKIVGEYGDVSYAEVGKTSVAGLNGLESTVVSHIPQVGQQSK